MKLEQLIIVILVIFICLHQSLAKSKSKSKQLKHARNERKYSKAVSDLNSMTPRIGFKPIKSTKNATLAMMMAKEVEKKRAEYNKVRLSPKHRHKIKRKSKVERKGDAGEKRSKVMERGNLDFHLAGEDKLVDERASKRVRYITKN